MSLEAPLNNQSPCLLGKCVWKSERPAAAPLVSPKVRPAAAVRTATRADPAPTRQCCLPAHCCLQSSYPQSDLVLLTHQAGCSRLHALHGARLLALITAPTSGGAGCFWAQRSWADDLLTHQANSALCRRARCRTPPWSRCSPTTEHGRVTDGWRTTWLSQLGC